MSGPATPTTTFPEADLIAINLSDRLGFWDNGWASPLTLHDWDGDEVDDPEDCIFVTTPTPDGRWAAAQRSDFENARH